MSIDIIEFMLRNSCSADEVKLFISNFLNIPKEKILPESEFWEKILIDEVDYISLEVTNAGKGFQTLVRCNLDTTTDSIFFEKLALRLVSFFDSDVVVPDRRGKLSGPDRSLLYLKDGRCAEAIDIFMDGYNDVEITSYINQL